MKNGICEKIVLLATASEHMTDVADMMVQWNSSQSNTEKYAFESINESDKVLAMSKEGQRLTKLLKDYCDEELSDSVTVHKHRQEALLEELNNLFLNISKSTQNANEILHNLEAEIALQKEIEEGMTNSLIYVTQNIDATLASTELLMADLK